MATNEGFDPEDFQNRSQDADPFGQVDAGEDDPERVSRDDREETYEDAFDDGGDGGGDSGGSSNDSTAPERPSAEEREETYEGAFDDGGDGGGSNGSPQFDPRPDTVSDDSTADSTADSDDDRLTTEERTETQRQTAQEREIEQASGGELTGSEFEGEGFGDSPSEAERAAVRDLEERTVRDLGSGDLRATQTERDGQSVVQVQLTEEARREERRQRREAASRINQADDRDVAGIDRRELDAFTGGDGVSEAQEVIAERRQEESQDEPQAPPATNAALPGGEPSPLSEAQGEALEGVDQQLPNADITREDVDFESVESDGAQQIRAELNDEGRSEVARARSPFNNVPVVGDVFDAGAEAGVEYREFVEENEQAYNEATPNTRELLGAAAVGVAAPEPVSSGTGVLVGATVLGAGAVASQARISPISASESAEIDVPDDATSQNDGEIDVTENTGQTREIEVPVERGQSVSAGEVGLPEEAFQETESGEIPVNTNRDDVNVADGEIELPADTTAVARQERYEEEEDEEDGETDEAEEERVVVEVPEEFIPDEEATIGDPDTAESGESEEAAPAETADGEAEEEAEEEFFRPIQRQGQESSFPEQTRTTEEFDDTAEEVEEQPQSPTSTLPSLPAPPAAQVEGAQGTPADALPAAADREDTAAASEPAQPAAGDLDAPLPALAQQPAQAQAPAQAQLPEQVPAQAAPQLGFADVFQVSEPASPAEGVAEPTVTEPQQTPVTPGTGTPSNSIPRLRLPGLDADGDGDDRDDLGVVDDIFTDFVDPLSGGVLETERGDAPTLEELFAPDR